MHFRSFAHYADGRSRELECGTHDKPHDAYTENLQWVYVMWAHDDEACAVATYKQQADGKWVLAECHPKNVIIKEEIPLEVDPCQTS